MLEHGGRLRAAALRYGINEADWLDLSTGINPNGWPVPALHADIWQRLPQDDDGLHQAAQDFYGTKKLLAVSGSQAAIQSLPALRPRARRDAGDQLRGARACLATLRTRSHRCDCGRDIAGRCGCKSHRQSKQSDRQTFYS